MMRDMVFLPKRREVYAVELEETPIITAILLLGRQLIDRPLCLLLNDTGQWQIGRPLRRR